MVPPKIEDISLEKKTTQDKKWGRDRGPQNI